MPIWMYFILIFCFLFGLGFRYLSIKCRLRFYVFLWPVLGFLLPLPASATKFMWRPVAFCLAYVAGVIVGSFLFRKVKPLPDPIKELIKDIKANGKIIVVGEATGEIVETKDFSRED